MKYLKNLLANLIIIVLLNFHFFIQPSQAILFGKNRTVLNGAELVQYGQIIMLEKGETLTISDSSKAEMRDGYLQVIGVGEFTITSSIYGTINCYAWNVHLAKGNYIYYKDESRTQAKGIFTAPSYLAASIISDKTLKVDSYLKNGKADFNVKDMYIENFYDSYLKKSRSSYFEYSFEQDVPVYAPEVKSIAITNPKSGTYQPGTSLTIRVTFSEKVSGNAPTLNLKIGNNAGSGTFSSTTPDGSTDYIDYTYVSSNNDSGKVSISNYYGGSLKSESGVDAIITVKQNTGNSITIQAPTTSSTLSTPSVPSSNKTFLQWAQECHNFIAKNRWSYDNAHTRPNMANYFANKIPKKQVDCSGYVSWVLYMYTNGKFNKSLKSYNFVSKCKSATYFPNLGFQVIKGQVTKAKCKPGDILLVNGHVEIYKGNGKSYSAGSTSAIRAINGTSTNFKRFNYIIRPIQN